MRFPDGDGEHSQRDPLTLIDTYADGIEERERFFMLSSESPPSSGALGPQVIDDDGGSAAGGVCVRRGIFSGACASSYESVGDAGLTSPMSHLSTRGSTAIACMLYGDGRHPR